MSEDYNLILNDHSDVVEDEHMPISQDDLRKYSIDTLLQKAGGFGRMQWFIIMFIFVSNQGFNFFSYNFAYLELVPLVLCKYTKNDEFIQCMHYTDICEQNRVFEWKVDYNNPYSFHNWITEHDLYCKSDFVIGALGSCYFIGFGFMGILLKFADSFGRKKLIFVGCAYHLALICAILFVNDYKAYFVLLFFGGISFAKETLIYIYATEIVPERFKAHVGGFAMLCQVVPSHIVPTLYFYFGGKLWREAYGTCLITTIISLLLCCLIPESPRYLHSKKDWPRLHQTLNKIASFNGIDVFRQGKNLSTNIQDKKLLHNEEVETAVSDRRTEDYSVLIALRDRRTFVNLVAIILCFAAVSFNFYIVGFFLKYIGGDIYINTLACALSEFLGTTSSGFIQKIFGTKKSIVLCFAVAALFAAPLMFIAEPIQIAASVLLVKYFIEVTFCFVYLIAPEYFDPLFVPFSFSICSFCARFITMAAPQVAEINPRQVPLIVFIAISVIATVSALLLSKPDQNDGSEAEKNDED